MGRKEKILPQIDRTGPGLEIGPSFNPVAPKSAGYNVQIIDHLNREQLREKYRNRNIENIEEVDYIWRGESYADLTGKKDYYKWIIASHLIEHTPDLIGFLNDCDTILKEDGVLFLVIPDKRFCFDRFRPITGISKVIDSHFNKNMAHTQGAVVEQILNAVSKDRKVYWDCGRSGEYNFYRPLSAAKDALQPVKAVYRDCHAWVFVPHSFRLIIHDLCSLGLISLQEVDFSSTEGCEFYISLGRKGRGLDKSRLEMLKIIESECGAPDYSITYNLINRLTKPFRKAKRYLTKRQSVKPL